MTKVIHALLWGSGVFLGIGIGLLGEYLNPSKTRAELWLTVIVLFVLAYAYMFWGVHRSRREVVS